MDVKLTDVKLSDFKYHWVDANNVVLTYTWTGKGTVMGQPVPSPTVASTLYTKRNGTVSRGRSAPNRSDPAAHACTGTVAPGAGLIDVMVAKRLR